MDSLEGALITIYIFALLGAVAVLGAAGYGLFKFVTWLF